MQHQERRRHVDTAPRATYAANTVLNQCRLVRANSFAYVSLLALDFEPIDRDGDCVLMRAPIGWECVQ